MTDTLSIQHGSAGQHLWAILLIAWVVTFIGLFDGGGRDLLNSLETGFVLTSHEFARDGHWIVPTQDGTPRTVKPPLPFWMAAVGEQLLAPLGVEPLVAMRIMSVVMGIATAVLIYLLGRQMFDRPAGLFAAIVWATCLQSSMEFRYARHDIYLTAFCALAYLGIWRAWQKQRFGWTLTAIGLLLAFQAKGPVSWALVVLPAIVWALIHRPVRWRYIAGLIGWMFIAGLLLLPWLIAYQYAIGQDKWSAFIWEGFTRFRSDEAPRGLPWWFYVRYLGSVMPWTVYFIATLIIPFEKRFAARGEPMTFLWLIVVVGLVFLSLPKDKTTRYIVPLMAATALLIGQLLSHHWQLWRAGKHDPKSGGLWFGHAVLMIVSAIVLPIYFIKSHHTGLPLALSLGGALLVVGLVTLWAFATRRVQAATIGMLVFAGVFLAAFYLEGALWPGYHEPLKVKAAAIDRIVGDAPLISYPGRADIALAAYLKQLAPAISDSKFTRTYLPRFAPPDDGSADAPVVRWLRAQAADPVYVIIDGDTVGQFQSLMHDAGYRVSQSMDLTTPEPRSDSHKMRDPLLLMRVRKTPSIPVDTSTEPPGPQRQ